MIGPLPTAAPEGWVAALFQLVWFVGWLAVFALLAKAAGQSPWLAALTILPVVGIFLYVGAVITLRARSQRAARWADEESDT